jgi:predicted outer membrane repeat protein
VATNIMNWIKPICLSLYKKSRRAAQKTYSSPFEITALEPKILLSAELLGGTVDATSFSLDNHHDVVDTDTGLSEWLKQVVEPIESTGTSASTVANDDATASLPDDLVLNGLAQFFAQQQQDAQNDQDMGQLLADAALAASHVNDQPLELIVIDPRTPDYLELVKGVSTDSGSDYLVYMLDAEQDGVQQVSDLLAQHQDLNAVHLISHGSSEGIQLGTTWLDNNSLAEYQNQISDWSAVFDAEADILIYGCDLAGAAAGEQLIQSLAQLTGADVAASTDVTGAASKGGDWDLEYQVGSIETNIAFSQQTQASWQGTLATFTVDTFNDTIDINLGDGLAIDADGNTSLRAAIMEANALAGNDIIELGAGTYTLGLAGAGETESATGDLNAKSNISILGVGANNTIIDGGGLDRVFEVSTPQGDLTLTGLTIQGGLASGDTGGGLKVVNPNASMTLNQVIVSGNQADDGAGIENRGTITLTDVEISDNTSTDLGTGKGGGLHNWKVAMLNNVTVNDNSAGVGGGIYSEGDLTLTNVTVSGNTAAAAEGGGIYNDDTLTLKNTTISNNDAQTQGGGIFNSSVTNISNTIVANNTATGSGNDVFGIFISDGSNLIEDVAGSASFGGDITGTDPALGSLADNGGFTQTHAITTSSAAYNSGTNSGAPAEDQRGIARDDATADIGAYEYKANNAPTATNLTQVQTYSEGNGSVELGNIVITDADVADTVTASLTLADIAAGSLSTGTFGASTSTYTAGTGVWTITGTVADVNSALATVAFVPATDHDTDTTISTHIEDAAATGPADGTISLNVIAQNDAPTATNMDQTINYGPGQTNIPLNDIVVSDVDTGEVITARLTVASILDGSLTTGTYGSATSSYNGLSGVWQITGSVTDVNAALADVVFLRALSLNGQTTITTQIQDQVSSGPANGTINLDLSAVNTASTATNLNQTKAYTEGAASVELDDIVVSDIDSFEVITATLTLADIAAGSLSTGTFGASTSTYTAGTGVWTVSGTVADVNSALAAVSFVPANDHDTNTTITSHIEDAAGEGPVDGTISLNVAAQNDAPTLSIPGQVFINEIHYDNVGTDTGEAIEIAGVAGTDLSGWSVLLYTGADGTVYDSVNLSGTIADQADGFGTVVINFPENGIENALAGTSDGLALVDSSGVVRQFLSYGGVFMATDGAASGLNSSDMEVRENGSTPVGQSLQLTGSSTSFSWSLAADTFGSVNTGQNFASLSALVNQSTDEDLSLVFNAANSNAIVVGDIDAATDGAADPLSVKLEVSSGSLTLGSVAGLGSVSGNATNLVTLTGSIAELNAALEGLTYQPAADFNGSDTLNITVNDQGNSGAGNTPLTIGSVNISVSPQNDEPSATNLTQIQAYTEGAASVALDDIVVTEVDTGDTVTATLTLADIAAGSLSTGTFGASTSTYTAGTGVWTVSGTVADVNSALAAVAFVPATNNEANTIITTHIEDAAGTGPVDGSITLNVTAQNDAPTATNLTQIQAYTEGAASVALDDIVVTEVDTGDTVTATLTLADIAAGSLSTGTFGASTSTYTAGTGVWRVTGMVADVNAALASVAFMPVANHDTDTSISIHIEDAAGTGPADGSITLDVTAVNDDPSLNNAVLDQAATEDLAFSFTLPNDTFEDVDTGAVITYSAQLSGGASLPAWLDFNASTRTFSGTPANADVGTLTIEVIADDSQGGTPASDTFDIVVANSNDDPTLDQPIANQAATEDSAFSFTFAASTFGDVDASNTLTYSAELSNGDALPSWLNFDANTRTFSGTPANADVGTISIEVSADDGQGGTPATDVFNIVVANTNDTPTGSVVISGTPTEDQILTADTSSVADDDGLAAFDYQWMRNGLAISGANASTYTLDDADVGASISVQISYTDARGEAESLTSTGTPAIANVNDAPVGDVSITGSATLGSTLTASNNLSDDDGLGSITYQWQRNGLDILGATTATYTLGITDIGSTINVVASYTDLNDTPESLSSAATALVTAVNNAPSGSVTIIGTAQEEQVLTADTSGLSDADGLGSYSYQWQADGSNIAGAVASTYTLDDSEVGKVITVVVSYNDGLGTAESVVSDPTSAVANVNDAPTATNLNQSKSYVEGAGSVALDDIVITEADTGQSVSATLILNNVSAGALTTGTFGAATSTYDGASGVWTVSGSVADVNAALAAVSFVPQTNNDLDTSISSHIEDAAGTGPTDGIISLDVTPQNDDPSLDQALADQNATEDSAFSFTFASNSFSDLDSADSLSYSALLSSGAALPVWLNFDAATRTFSGSPANDDVGVFQVEVFADDGQGGMAASDIFSITVANINDAPTLDQAIGNQSATEDSAFSFTFNAATFSDVDVGDTLSYSALQSDGSALPAWLNFDDSSRTFSGTPANSDVGSLTIEVTANDGNGGSVTDTFDIVVANSNDDPTLDQMIPDQAAAEDAAYSFTFNTATFSDVDAGDTLSYTATQNDGSALPTWLSFDANSRTFSGTPANTDVGNLTIEVIADDGNGGQVSDTFELVVSDSNDAPTGGVQISGSPSVGESLTADTSRLSDEDGLGILSYQWLKNGSAIVGADSASYVVTSSDVGSSLSVRVSYVDGGGSSETLRSASILAVSLEPDDLPETPEEIELVLPPASPPPAEEAPEEVEEESEESEEADEEVEAGALLDEVDTTSRFSGVDADRFENPIDAIDIPDFERDLSSDGNAPVASVVFDGPQEGTIEEKEAIYKEGTSGITNFEEDPLLLIQTSNFIKGLDNMREEVSQNVSLGKTAVGSSFALSAGVSAGYVAWLARSGVLLSSVLSSLPVWRFVDPLPVLSSGSNGPMFKDEESLESLVSGDGASVADVDGDASLPEGQEGKNNEI